MATPYNNEEDTLSVSSMPDDDDLMSSSPSEKTGTNAVEARAVQLGSKETRLVALLRLAVILVLITATSIVSVSVYKFTSSQEQADFHDAYGGFSAKVIEALKLNVER
jgi:cytochrome c-type biogenesis protein CcmH/NrfG